VTRYPIVRLQVQRYPMKAGRAPLRYYEPAALVSVQRLLAGPSGVRGITADGEKVLDVHHQNHPQCRDRRTGAHLATTPLDEPAQRSADAGVIRDALFGHPDRRNAARVWLDLRDLPSVENLEALQPILPAALEQRMHTRDLVVLDGNDQLAALVVIDAVLLAERDHLLEPPHGEAGLLRTGAIVQAGVHDAGVVRRLMLADVALLLEERDPIVATGLL